MLLALLLACGLRVHPHVEAVAAGDAPSWGTLGRDGVALAPVVLVQALPAPPLPPDAPVGVIGAQLEDPALPSPTVLDPVADAPFLRNDFLGHIRFGGGYILAGSPTPMYRARLLEFNAQESYRAQGSRWLADELAEVLAEHHLAPVPAAAVEPPLDRRPVRGLTELDGRDNVNLPRSTLVPGALPPRADGPPWLLVPLLRSYYTHNGGWFIGQQWGCMSGARVEVLVVLYNQRTGAPVWWMSAEGRHVESLVGQPSTAEIDQYLLWAEGDVEAALERRFLKDG